MILWIVNWQFTRNSDLNQGLFDLLAHTVRYVPEEKQHLVSVLAWKV